MLNLESKAMAERELMQEQVDMAYRIVVQGGVAGSQVNAPQGMSIVSTVQTGQGVTATFEGVVADQAALVHVLGTLHQSGLLLLAVACLEKKDAGSGHSPAERA